jgi:hypothetical protein
MLYELYKLHKVYKKDENIMKYNILFLSNVKQCNKSMYKKVYIKLRKFIMKQLLPYNLLYKRDKNHNIYMNTFFNT